MHYYPVFLAICLVLWEMAHVGISSSYELYFPSIPAAFSGLELSYKAGACRIIPKVPTIQAVVKIHRNRRSSTNATYFQSSLI